MEPGARPHRRIAGQVAGFGREGIGLGSSCPELHAPARSLSLPGNFLEDAMRFALIAALLLFAAPAIAQEPVKFPEKIQRTDFQGVIADAGPAYVAGQPTEAALRDMAAK